MNLQNVQNYFHCGSGEHSCHKLADRPGVTALTVSLCRQGGAHRLPGDHPEPGHEGGGEGEERRPGLRGERWAVVGVGWQ